MNLFQDISTTTIVVIIYFIGGLYLLITGILIIANVDLSLTIVYKIGVFISNLVQGKKKTQNFESDMKNPRKRVRIGVLMCFIGLLFLAGGIYLLNCC